MSFLRSSASVAHVEKTSRSLSPRPQVAAVSLFATTPKESKAKTPDLIEVDFAMFLEQFMTATLDDSAESKQCLRIVERSRQFVKEALDDVPDHLGRVFNDFPLVFQTLCSVNRAKMNAWVKTCYQLIEERNSVVIKVMTLSLPQKDGSSKTCQEQVSIVENAADRATIQIVMDEILAETCQQMLENNKIKKQFIDILQIQKLFEDDGLNATQVELNTLRLAFSYVINVIFGNMSALLAAEARICEVNFMKFEQKKSHLLHYLNEMLFAPHVTVDGSHNHKLAGTPRFTGYYIGKILNRTVVSADRPKSDFILSGAPEMKVQVDDLDEKYHGPRLSQQMFRSYFSNQYPLADVPKKFELANFAAITPEDKRHLMSMIVQENFSYQPVIEARLAKHLEDVQITMSSAVTHALTGIEEEHRMHRLSADFIFLSEVMTPTAQTPTPKKSSTTMDFKEAGRISHIINVFKSHILADYSATKLGKVASILKHSLHPHNRGSTVRHICNLKPATAEEFVAVFQAEYRALQHQKGVVATALSACKMELEKTFAEECLTVKRKADSAQFDHAVALLHYVAKSEKAPFGAVKDKQMEIEAARSIAHHLVRLSLVTDQKKMHAQMDVLLGGMDSVCQVKKMDSGLVTLLKKISDELTRKCQSSDELSCTRSSIMRKM